MDEIESTEEQVQRRSSSSRRRHSAQAGSSREKVGNLPTEPLNEEQEIPISNHINENKENGILEENKVSQQNTEKIDQSISEFVGSQIEAAEAT